MKLFIDSANVEEIKEANELGILAGVTTNPSLVAKSGRDFTEVLQEIISIVDGPISAEVLSSDVAGMIREGEQLAKLSSKINIKVPMTWEGLKAVNHFSSQGVNTNVTLIFSVNQALMAARAGASFVSPFIGRLDDISSEGMELVGNIIDVFSIHQIETEVIAASIRHPMHVTNAALAGAHISTIPLSIYKQMVIHPLTDQGIAKFTQDWQQAVQKKGE